jgi:hypothetical protein
MSEELEGLEAENARLRKLLRDAMDALAGMRAMVSRDLPEVQRTLEAASVLLCSVPHPKLYAVDPRPWIEWCEARRHMLGDDE